MKNKLKFLLAVMAVIIAFMGISAAAAASGSCGDNLTWSFNDADGVLTISGMGEMDDYADSSEQPWLEQSDDITRIIIEEGVTHIGSNAFNGCSALKEAVIPDTVTYVGEAAFRSCSAMENVKLPNAETTYGVGVFRSCSALKEIDIPEKMTAIPESMFYYCSSLTKVNFHDNVTDIGKGAFGNCFKDESVEVNLTLPKNLKTIGENAFEYSQMKGITLPEGLTAIGQKAFLRCSKLEKIEIPSTITVIENSVFEYCSNLKEISMPSITQIGENAFYAIGAEAIVLPEGLKTIGDSAFSASKLKEVSFPESVTQIGAGAFSSTKLEKVTFPGSVEVMSERTFQRCQSLTEVVVEEGVTSIGTWAFGYCTKLEKITLPDSVAEIEKNTFTGCSALKSIKIPENVTIINAIFTNAIALEEIIIQQFVVAIDDAAFTGAPKTVVVKGYNGSVAEKYAQNKGYTFVSLGEITEEIVPAGGQLSDTVKWSLTNTGKLIFSGEGEVPALSTMPWKLYNNAIKTIVAEEGITSVGKMDFSFTRNIEKVSVHYSVKAFDENTLKSIVSEAVFEGYSKTWVEHLVVKNNRTFVALGEAPYHEMVAGTTTNKNITWALDNRGALVIKGTGKMSSYDFSSAPWYKYCSLVEKITIEAGITTVSDLRFDQFINLKEIEISHTVGSIWRNLADVTEGIIVKVYNDSYAEFVAKNQSLTIVALGEAEEVIIASGDAGDDENATYTVSSKGVLTISGWGETEYCSSDFARSWDKYSAYIKKIVIEKGITKLQTFHLSGCTSLETIEMSYSVLGTGIIDAPENLRVKGYTHSHAEAWAAEKGFAFESLGVTPYDFVVSGTIGDAQWGLDGYGTLTLSGSGTVNIPIATNAPWYSLTDYIYKVDIKEGITRVERHIFNWCDNVETVILPQSMEYFSTYDLPRTVTYHIYRYSAMHDQLDGYTLEFTGTMPLELVEEGSFGDNITWRYYNHRILEIEGSGDMPEDIEVPWESYLETLETIKMPDTITSIAPWAFCQARVTELTIPSSVTRIGENAFAGCVNVKEIVVPPLITQIGNEAFAGCKKLEKITFPSGIILADFDVLYNTTPKEICGNNDTFAERVAAKYNKSDQTQFVSLGEAPERSFMKVMVSDTVYFEVDNLGDFIFSGTGEIPDMSQVSFNERPWTPYMTDNTDTIIIKGTVKKIGNSAFCDYAQGKMVIEEGVEEIGEYAFAGLPITEIKLPDSVATIGMGAFRKCVLLEKVWLGENVRTIPDSCFALCYELEFMEMPRWITAIEEDAFYYSTGLRYVHYRGTKWHWDAYMTGEENLPANATIFYESYLPEAVECEITSVEKSKKDVAVTVSYALCGDERAFMAAYNADGALIEAVSIQLGNDTYTLNKDTAVVKVFVWQSNIKPILEADKEEIK